MPGMFDAAEIAGIDRIIQMAAAPAVLLSGIFAGLDVPTSRPGPLIDRERHIRDRLRRDCGGERRLLAAFVLAGVRLAAEHLPLGEDG